MRLTPVSIFCSNLLWIMTASASGAIFHAVVLGMEGNGWLQLSGFICDWFPVSCFRCLNFIAESYFEINLFPSQTSLFSEPESLTKSPLGWENEDHDSLTTAKFIREREFTVVEEALAVQSGQVVDEKRSTVEHTEFHFDLIYKTRMSGVQRVQTWRIQTQSLFSAT